MEWTITRQDLLSEAAVRAFDLADYRLRHNARYFGWSEERRTKYRLAAAFDAIIAKRERESA